jgi:hypothetical protein
VVGESDAGIRDDYAHKVISRLNCICNHVEGIINRWKVGECRMVTELAVHVCRQIVIDLVYYGAARAFKRRRAQAQQQRGATVQHTVRRRRRRGHPAQCECDELERERRESE